MSQTDLRQTRADILILGNVTVLQLEGHLQKFYETIGMVCQVETAEFNTIVARVQAPIEARIVFIFWEITNIFENSWFKIQGLESDAFDALVEQLKAEIDMVFVSLSNVPLVFFNAFSAIKFASSMCDNRRLEVLCGRLNRHIEGLVKPNFKVLNIDKIVASMGFDAAFNDRLFYAVSAPYSDRFFKHYVEVVCPTILALHGQIKKVLVLDCDNTLYGGVVGEDGIEGIHLSSQTFPGVVFQEVHSLLIELYSRGVILCLSTKNDLSQIVDVFERHPDSLLKLEHFQVIKANWDPKPDNIMQIADELNVGIDSLVFIDDSDFETDLAKSQLPGLDVYQVPKELAYFPNMMRQISDKFVVSTLTSEDIDRQSYYVNDTKRNEAKKSFKDFDEYLMSLGLEIQISKNNQGHATRLSQLTLKTNQFNLTTLRYAESEMTALLKDANTDVFSCAVSDKFGSSGITGLVVVTYTDDVAHIDTFLMSCRILGKKIEHALISSVLLLIHNKRGISLVTASYRATKKNAQVEKFYEECDFELLEDRVDQKKYGFKISSTYKQLSNHIEVLILAP